MSIDYGEIKDLVEHDPIHRFNSGHIQSMHNLLVNFDNEVIPLLAEDEDEENYTRVIEQITEMQMEMIDMYYDLFPPFRQAVNKLNSEVRKSENK